MKLPFIAKIGAAMEFSFVAWHAIGFQLMIQLLDYLTKNARYFIQDWGADFIMGTDSSPLAKAVAEVLPELKKIFIVTHAATPDINEVLVYKKKIKYP